MKVIVDVTMDDITDGEQGSCWACPVALAIGRALPEYVASVFDDSLILLGRRTDEHHTLHVSEEVEAFIRSFDNDGDVRPFSFELEI